MGRDAISLLLVESDCHDFSVTRSLLQECPFGRIQVQWARSLYEALLVLRSATVDAIVAELDLSDSRGLQTFAAMSERAPGLPVVILTSLSSEAEGLRAVSLGAQDCLVKGEVDELTLARAVFMAVKRKRCENNARTREEQEIADFLNTAPFGVLWVTPDGRLIGVNRSGAEGLGYRANELLGRHFSTLQADEGTADSILTRLTEGERLRDFQVRLRSRDGEIRYALVDSGVFMDNEEFVHARVIVRDITQCRRTEIKADLQSAMLASITSYERWEDVMLVFMDSFVSVLDWDACNLWLSDTGDGALRNTLSCQRNDPSGMKISPDEPPLVGGPGVAARVFRRGRAEWIPDIHTDPDFEQGNNAGLERIRSALVAPIYFEGEPFGVIECFTSKSSYFDTYLLIVLESLFAQLGRFIGKKRRDSVPSVSLLPAGTDLEEALETGHR